MGVGIGIDSGVGGPVEACVEGGAGAHSNGNMGGAVGIIGGVGIGLGLGVGGDLNAGSGLGLGLGLSLDANAGLGLGLGLGVGGDLNMERSRSRRQCWSWTRSPTKCRSWSRSALNVGRSRAVFTQEHVKLHVGSHITQTISSSRLNKLYHSLEKNSIFLLARSTIDNSTLHKKISSLTVETVEALFMSTSSTL